jgi:RHS repeat-associated protein
MNTIHAFITGRSLPPRCSRISQVRPFPIKTVPRTVFMGNVHNRLAEQKSNHPSGLIGNTSNPTSTATVGRAFTYNANHQLAGIAQLVQSINPANQTDPNNLPSNVFGSVLENRSYSSDGHTKDVNPSGTNNEQTGATVDRARTYLYDASERLVEVRQSPLVVSPSNPSSPSSGSGQAQTVATYRYDPFGRRVRKTVSIPNTTITPQNPIAQQAGTTFFGFASEGMIAEFKDNGDFKVSYAYTPALASGSHATWQTNPLYKREPSPSGGGQGGGSSGTDNLHAFHTDHLGTTQALTAITATQSSSSPPTANTSVIGKVTWRASYESFGEAFVDQTITNAANLSSGSATENNHRFPGQFYDQETGLAQNYFRDYENVIGRYVQGDPLGLGGGINTYAYAMAFPMYGADPTGLECFALASYTIKGSWKLVDYEIWKSGWFLKEIILKNLPAGVSPFNIRMPTPPQTHVICVFEREIKEVWKYERWDEKVTLMLCVDGCNSRLETVRESFLADRKERTETRQEQQRREFLMAYPYGGNQSVAAEKCGKRLPDIRERYR